MLILLGFLQGVVAHANDCGKKGSPVANCVTAKLKKCLNKDTVLEGHGHKEDAEGYYLGCHDSPNPQFHFLGHNSILFFILQYRAPCQFFLLFYNHWFYS